MLDIQDKDFISSKPSPELLSGKESPPNAIWQTQGKNLVERAQKCLWSSAGKEALDYLLARGLRDEIIRKKKIGYIPLQSNGKYYESSLESWGLDPEKETKDKVRIPNGILIPWFDGDNLWRLALKRPVENQYGQVLGSGEGLFNVGEIQYDHPAMMVEGEICCMSIEQESGDLISCVATGSTTRGRLNKWAAELGLASYVLQSYDEDESGDNGAEYWQSTLKKCQRWSPWVAKDPNDILRGKFFPEASPCTLREWVEAGIAIMQVEKLHATIDMEIQARPFAIDSIPPCKVVESFPIDLSKTKWHGPDVDMKALSLQEWKENCLPRMKQIKQKDHFPPWLIPGTDDWKKLVKRVGLEEVNERRQVALSELV